MKLPVAYRFGLAILVSLAFVHIAEACSCGPRSNVLDTLERSKNVVIVTAVGVNRANVGEQAVDGVTSTKMVVDKVYKGKLKAGDQILFGQGGGADCLWTFNEESVGKKYLFYLSDGDKEGRWLGFGCGRSSNAEFAGEDLLYLDNLSKLRGKTRISGTVEFDGFGDADSPSVEKIKVRISGPGGTRILTTDKNGVYEVYGLPPGNYHVAPEVPRGWRVNQFYLGYVKDLIGNQETDRDSPLKDYVVRLEPGRHASLGFRFEIHNALRGRVLDPDGIPMNGVCLRLFPPTGVTKDFIDNADCTEKDGRFVLDEIRPDNYIIVANDENEISSSEPFATLYYPGVYELEKATVFSVGLGEFRDDLEFRVPQVEKLVTIRGRFLWSDGQPVIDESVKFLPATKSDRVDGEARATTDSKGRFELKILKGLKGTLVGSMYAYIGMFEKCTKLETFIRSQEKTGLDIRSSEITIDATEDVDNIEITFPFPGCQKTRD